MSTPVKIKQSYKSGTKRFATISRSFFLISIRYWTVDIFIIITTIFSNILDMK